MIINPNNAYYYYNLGLVQCELKKYKDSLLSFDIVIKLMPNYAEAHLCKGDILIKLEKNERVSISEIRNFGSSKDDLNIDLPNITVNEFINNK